MTARPLILVTNDDGVEAEGIKRLTASLRDLGDIIVFAPDGARSGMSAAITCDKPISYRLLAQEDGLTIYSCTGTPTDCVKLALNIVLQRRPDIVVSGINHGGNEALAVHYSGTMGAAFEGCVFEIPSIGVSLAHYDDGADFSESCRMGHILVEHVLKTGLPYDTYLNLNIPNIPKVKGIKIGCQTQGKWEREYDELKDENGNLLYCLTGDFIPREKLRPDNDIAILDEGYASLVPCKIDVTDYEYLEKLNFVNFE